MCRFILIHSFIHSFIHSSRERFESKKADMHTRTRTHAHTRVILGTKNDYCYYCRRRDGRRDAIVALLAHRGRIERERRARGVVKRERARDTASTRTRLLEKRSAVRR